MNLTFLAAADIHLGNGSSGVKRTDTFRAEWAEQTVPFSSATAAWYRLVDAAVDHQVDAVLLAGDLIDRENHFFHGRAALLDGFRRLQQYSIPVVMVAGNHDHIVLPEIMDSNPMDGVYLLGRKGTWEEQVLELKGQPVSVVGWSFPSSHVRYNPLTRFTLPDSGHPRIGLLHGDAGLLNSTYAPFELASLRTGGVDCWVLGHIHKPQQVAQHPLAFYPGSPQAMSAKETGVHGAVLLRSDSWTTETLSLSTVRFERLEVDISGALDQTDANVHLQDALRLWGDSDEQPDVTEYVLDLVWTGDIADPLAPAAWRPEDPGTINDRYFSIRSVDNRCTAPLPELGELAKGAGPAAILSRAILDIRSGTETDFIKRLRARTQEQLQKMNGLPAYQPLRENGLLTAQHRQELDELMIQECQALLSTLMLTREDE